MLHFLLQKADFIRGEIEEAIDAVVDLGFGCVERLCQAGMLGALFDEVGFPFVGSAWVLHWVGGELEALLQGFAQRDEVVFPPRLGLLVQGIAAGSGKGLEQAVLHFDLRLITLLSEGAACPCEVRDSLPLRLWGVRDGNVLHVLSLKPVLPAVTAKPERLGSLANEEPSCP